MEEGLIGRMPKEKDMWFRVVKHVVDPAYALLHSFTDPQSSLATPCNTIQNATMEFTGSSGRGVR
jgi:hypothetical protein